METNPTLQTLDKLTERVAEIKEAKSQLAAQEKALNEEYAEIEAKIIGYLEEAELENFRGKRGLVSIVNNFRVKVPQSIEDKKAFGKYLDKKKIFWELMSINSQTLNSFYKQEMETAIGEGNVEFKIPGIGDRFLDKKISFRKGS